MARSEKKKKKGIVQRLMFGDDSKPDITPESMQMSKWQMFKNLFFGRFGTMVLLNLLTMLFALPAIIVMVLFYLNNAVADGYIPYSSNIGFGYPVVVDAVSQGFMTAFIYDLYEYLILIPCIAVFALGVAGNLYVIRKLIWQESTRTVKDFFRGIKKCWLPAIFIGIAFGLTLLLVVFSLGYFDAYHLSSGLKIFTVIVAIVLLVIMVMFTSFFMTQTAAFKMSPMVLIRNSFLFVVGTNIQGIIFIGISLAPVYLLFIPGITTLLAIIYAFIGFSISTLGISLYCHYCYEKFLYDKIEGKPSTAYVKRGNDIAEEKDKPDKKKPQAVAYKNPKKRKKSIDEGSSITPLAPTFRREDLERLQKEHEQVMNESSDDYDEQAQVSDGEKHEASDAATAAVDTPDNVDAPANEEDNAEN